MKKWAEEKWYLPKRCTENAQCRIWASYRVRYSLVLNLTAGNVRQKVRRARNLIVSIERQGQRQGQGQGRLPAQRKPADQVNLWLGFNRSQFKGKVPTPYFRRAYSAEDYIREVQCARIDPDIPKWFRFFIRQTMTFVFNNRRQTSIYGQDL